MRPEGFRQVLTDRGTEGALLVLADALESLARRVNAQEAVEDRLRGEAKAEADAPPPPRLQSPPQSAAPEGTPATPQSVPSAPPPAPAPALEAGKNEASNG